MPTPNGDPQNATGRVKRRLAVVAPGVVVLIAAAFSLGGHLGAAFAAWDRPLGYVDPESLRTPSVGITVRRATVDEFRGPVAAAADPLGLGPTPDLAADDASRRDDLLDDLPIPDREIELELRLRELDEPAPTPTASAATLDLPAFELDASVLRELEGDRPDDLAFSDASGFDAQSAALAGAADGRLRALDYLAEVGRGGGVGGGENAGDGGDPRAAALEQLPGADRRGVPADLLRPGRPPASAITDLPPEPAPLDAADAGPPPLPLDDDFDYALYRFRPAPGFFNRDAGDGYFRIDLTPRRSLRKLAAMPKDVVYLVDTSASLPQPWVDASIAGVEASLASLNPGDRFNVVLFNESPSMLSPDGPLPADPDAIAFASRFLKRAESRGFTDVNAATRRLLVRDREQDRVYYLVLVSDGRPTRGVIDTRRLIDLITRDNDLAASIYCVGVGDRQDRELLDFLAYRNKGESVFVDDARRAPAAIADLLSRLRYPLIRDARFAVLGADADRLYPKALPNVHQGQRLSLFGRYADLRPLTMRIAGVSADGPVDLLFTLAPRAARAGDEAIATGWAKWKLHDLYDRVLREGRSDALMREVRNLEREYDLRTLY